ncbi:MAG: M1 family peptidase [Williamsia sp.]|nr:M1 family peptidase [Williamsia sp.]
MKRFTFLLACLVSLSPLFSQTPSTPTDTSWMNVYRATYPRINDLVHTKLQVKFDYDKSYLYGNAWITLKPHFYPTDSLTLDAKGMDLHKVELVNGSTNSPLKYDYDGMLLRIHLNKTYKASDKYTVYIDYTSKPNEVKVKGSAAINDAKGLYFINPKGEDKDKPTQIWTQGETEANSVWFPTIDKPNQRCTEEIYMTVPDKYVTLSNGLLTSQKKNGDGTRTDYWKMDLPHAPYLFFMGVGDYTIIKDSYKGKEVSYYVEKEYASEARKIFGLTPEMMGFYARITGVEYPWAKYSQITGRDYVSGAMENTTATLHTDALQQDARELVDGNKYEEYVAHELFHQWFGDLVTTESWSNLTVNESFANYSEVLWNQYKYGKDAGDEKNYEDMEGYLRSKSEAKDLVRFHYADKEDMFDAVSYNKGGRILHMLRNYLGDSAFFKGLNLYLTTNKFKSAEAHQLRLAMEEVSGRDLNWFFNQWYFGSGHPVLTIDYQYDDNAKKVKVTIRQVQQSNTTFTLPIAIDVYNGAHKVRHDVWMTDREQTFTFDYQSHPDLVNVDGDKILLCEKKDNKTLDNYVHQYKYAGNYLDRREAIEACAAQQDDPKALALLKEALKDKFYGIRNVALDQLDMKKAGVKQAVEATVADMAKNEPRSTVRAKAITVLGTYNKPEYKPLFATALNDSSYSVAGAALEAISIVDAPTFVSEVSKLRNKPAKGKLGEIMNQVMMETGTEEDFNTISKNFDRLPLSDAKIEAMQPFSQYLAKINDTEKFKKGINMIVSLRDAIPAQYQAQFTPFVNNMILKGIVTKKKAELKGDREAEIQKQIDYVNAVIEGKKGF